MIHSLRERFRKFFSREILTYLFWGVCTTLVNILLFHTFTLLSIDYKLANLIAIVVTKIFAFIVNKVFVFKSHVTSYKNLFEEFVYFFLARSFTGIVDFVGLIILVDGFHAPQNMSKYALQVVVIILNYVFSKKVFSKS